MLFYDAECYYAECRILLNIMVNVVMLSVIMVNAVMLSIIMVNIVMQSDVVPPQQLLFTKYIV